MNKSVSVELEVGKCIFKSSGSAVKFAGFTVLYTEGNDVDEKKEAKLPKTTACIRCGSCTNTCPFGLAPASILLAYKKKDTELLEKLSVETCMECGCCSFVCPARRPLVENNKIAKAELRKYQAEKNGGNK